MEEKQIKPLPGREDWVDGMPPGARRIPDPPTAAPGAKAGASEAICGVVGHPEAGRKVCELRKGHEGYHQDGGVRWLGYPALDAGNVAPETKAPLRFSYETYPRDVLTVEGTHFSGDFFRFFQMSSVGTTFHLVKNEDGVITIIKVED